MADWGKIANAGLIFGPGTIQAVSDISQGKGVVKSVANAGFDIVKTDIISGLISFPAMLGITAAQFAGAGAKMAIDHGQEKAAKTKQNLTGTGKVGNGFFASNELGDTMRQRSLQAIGGHQQMTRNILGSEARRRASSINY